VLRLPNIAKRQPLATTLLYQLNNLADNGCIYCGGSGETRDPVPSKYLLEQPHPANFPVVGCCGTCNHDFSKDEKYCVCLN
jgi:hypothetical protein